MGPRHAHLSVLALGPHLTLSLSSLTVNHHSQQLGPQPRPFLFPYPLLGLTLVCPSRFQALLPSPPEPQHGLSAVCAKKLCHDIQYYLIESFE
ncbi:unnamed protein product [Boreogadus saida]